MTEDNITALFVEVDDFYQSIKTQWIHYLKLNNGRKRHREKTLSESEIITISILFHQSGYRCFKQFYLYHVCSKLVGLFPRTMSYPRMVIAMQSLMPLFHCYFKTRLVKPSGISFIDSTSIKVCHNKRIIRNKVFAGLAKRGKTTMGWFYGFKLHLIITHEGELVVANLTQGDVDDRKPIASLTQKLFGKLYGDKGYLSSTLTAELATRGITLITNVRKNMKARAMSYFDKAVLKKRFLIETVYDLLKNRYQIEHTRHRSPINFLTNLLTGLIAYTFSNNKPTASIDKVVP